NRIWNIPDVGPLAEGEMYHLPRKAVESSGMIQQAILGTINAVARNQTEHLVEKLGSYVISFEEALVTEVKICKTVFSQFPSQTINIYEEFVAEQSKKQNQRKTYAIQLQEQLQSDIKGRRRRISKVESEGESSFLMNATNRQPIKPLHLIKLTLQSSAFNTTPLSNYSNPRSWINNYQSHPSYHQTNQIIQPTSHDTPSNPQIVSTPNLQHYNNNLIQQPQTMAIINPNKQNKQLAGGTNAYSPQTLTGGATVYSPLTIRLNKSKTRNRTLAGGASAYSPQQNKSIFQENINDVLTPLPHQLINVEVDIPPQKVQFNNQSMTEQMKNIQKQFPTAIMTQQETIVTKYSHQMFGTDNKQSNSDTITLQTGELFPIQKQMHNHNLNIAKQIP
ncbi:MAG: hypothetical protein EZS28_022419, partial [Streblomastix strix]